MGYSIKQVIIYLVIAAVIFSGIGYFAGRISVSSKKSATLEKNTFEDGLEAAYNRLMQRGQAGIAARGYGFRESNSIGGSVKEINNGVIALNVNPVNVLADPALDVRMVDANSAKIYKQVEKTPEDLQKDMEAFDKKMQELANNSEAELPAPPEPFGKQEISLNELKAEDRILITAEKDIHNVKEFKAIEILVQ